MIDVLYTFMLSAKYFKLHFKTQKTILFGHFQHLVAREGDESSSQNLTHVSFIY